MWTLTDLTPYVELVEKIEALFPENDEAQIEVKTSKIVPYTEDDFLEEVYIDKENYYNLVNLLKRKKNLVLTGSPGVGKTFSAMRLAYSIMGVEDSERVTMIQFHQSYSYEDFIMGYAENTQIGTHITDYLHIPAFNPKNRYHERLVQVAEDAMQGKTAIDEGRREADKLIHGIFRAT